MVMLIVKVFIIISRVFLNLICRVHKKRPFLDLFITTSSSVTRRLQRTRANNDLLLYCEAAFDPHPDPEPDPEPDPGLLCVDIQSRGFSNWLKRRRNMKLRVCGKMVRLKWRRSYSQEYSGLQHTAESAAVQISVAEGGDFTSGLNITGTPEAKAREEDLCNMILCITTWEPPWHHDWFPGVNTFPSIAAEGIYSCCTVSTSTAAPNSTLV